MKTVVRSSSLLSRAPASLLALAFLALGACSNSEPGGPSGSGGTTGRGGASGSGGSSATGGRTGSGGSNTGTGGSTGSGGTPASGSGGAGGSASGGGGGSTGGAGGTGGTAADAGNDLPPTADLSNDRPSDRPTDLAADLATDSMTPGATLDSCFAGLRAGRSSFQIGNKASADGKYRTRLALETGDRVGTSGTKPWVGYRFAIETPDGVVCVKDEAVLVAAYKASHHNCTDSYDITAEGRRFVITNPEIDPTKPKSKLTIFMGTTMIAGPIELTNGACTNSNGGICSSGGPC